MKNIRQLAVVIFWVVCQKAIGQQKTILKLTNNTNQSVNVAYAYFDAEAKEYISIGWYAMPPFTDKDLDLGYQTGKFFIHGFSEKVLRYNLIGEPVKETKTWGKGYSFCVDKTRFKMRDADIINCDTKVQFSLTNLTAGANTWRFDP